MSLGRYRVGARLGGLLASTALTGVDPTGECVGRVLVLDFVNGIYGLNGRRYDNPSAIPGWSFSRASTGTALTSSGTIVSFGSGVPRITDLGLLIEQAATNLFLNSFAPVTQTITLSATGNYTLSVWGAGSVAVAAGTATITGAGSASSGAAKTINCTVTGTVTLTVTGSPTAVNFEAGAFGTSPILTTSAAATRAADVAKIAGLSLPAAWAVLVAGSYNGVSASGFPAMLSVNDGTNSNRVNVFRTNSTGAMNVEFVAGGVSAFSPSLSTLAAGATAKIAARAQTGSLAAVKDGGTVSTSAAAFAPALSTVIFGGSFFAPELNGYLQRVVVYPTAYSDAQLQALTQ